MQTKYTTLAKVKAKVTTTLTDPEIENIISLVSGYIDVFLGYKLATDFSNPTVNILLDGSGTEYLMLPQPVYGFTSVDYVAFDGSVTPLQYIASYPLNETYKTYIAMKAGRFAEGMANYRISGAKLGIFSVDWVTPANHTLDDAVTQVATAMCVEMISNNNGSVALNQKGEYSGKVTAEKIGADYSVQYQDVQSQKELISSVPTATDILGKYKLLAIV